MYSEQSTVLRSPLLDDTAYVAIVVTSKDILNSECIDNGFLPYSMK